MVIDAHIHHYPAVIRDNPIAWAEKMGEPLWAKLIAPRSNRPSLQGWASTTGLLRAMDTAGVDRVVILGWYWQQQESCALQNNWLAKLIKGYSDRFSGFAAVQPLGGQKAFEALKYAIDAGLCGIGECFPGAQGFCRDDPVWLDVLSWAEANCLPVNLHVTEPVGRPFPGRTLSPLEDYLWWAKNFPKLKLILAHWGGGLPFFELNSFCQKHLKNVYYDTAASPLLYDQRIFQTVIGMIGKDRILYGSDYPLKLYPGRQKEPDFSSFITAIKGLKMEPSTEQALLGSNAQGLLGL